jgi:hypothetical protein
MQLPRRRRPRREAQPLFLDPSQAELWTRLSAAQQQACQELLSQLLEQTVREPNGTTPHDARGHDHERQNAP